MEARRAPVSGKPGPEVWRRRLQTVVDGDVRRLRLRLFTLIHALLSQIHHHV